ncbi:MAG: trimethylamine methyltransferase family protein [bacterium]
MNTGSPKLPVFEVLNPDEIERIHEAALEVLWQVGVDFLHEEALALFRQAGAALGGTRVQIPLGLIKDVLGTTPASVTLYTRDGRPAVVLEGREVHFGAYPTNLYYYDRDTGDRRPSTRETIAEGARLCDYLPSIEWSAPLGTASDVPVPVADRHQFHQAVINQRKPIYASAYSPRGLADIIEMAAVIAGGKSALAQRPFFIAGINPTSPLRYSNESAGKLLVMAQAGLPLVLNSVPMSGATAPSTMAATIVVALAEDLAGLALAQLKNPGVPVIVGGVLAPMDMRTSVIALGGPELTLMMAGLAQMCRHYTVPSYGTAGCSNSKTVDPQAAIEATNSILGALLAGSNLVHDVGLIDAGQTISLEALVMGNEIIRIARRIAEGISVSRETLACDLIKQVGPGGHFLGTDHTLRHFREYHRSELIDRRRYDDWVRSGSKSMNDRLGEEVDRILGLHHPQPLPPEVLRELRHMLRRFAADT